MSHPRKTTSGVRYNGKRDPLYQASAEFSAAFARVSKRRGWDGGPYDHTLSRKRKSKP